MGWSGCGRLPTPTLVGHSGEQSTLGDGAASEDAIVDDLAATFGAPREQIAGDVRAFLDDLGAKMLVTFNQEQGNDG